MSSLSWPAVHPVETPEMANGGAVIPRVRMKELQGMPGTVGGLVLRLCQFSFAVIGLVIMITTRDFPSVTAFRYLVAAVSLQSVWSLSLAIADIYALSVGRTLRNIGVARLFTIGDAMISTLTFTAACASAGITVLISQDMGICKENHCMRFMSATAMAFLSWFAASSSFFFNFWSLATR